MTEYLQMGILQEMHTKGRVRIPIFKYCKIVFLIVILQPELDLNSREASE